MMDNNNYKAALCQLRLYRQDYQLSLMRMLVNLSDA
jgi:hypothetical protein